MAKQKISERQLSSIIESEVRKALMSETKKPVVEKVVVKESELIKMIQEQIAKALKEDKCPKGGCIKKKSNGKWGVISGKTGKFWDADYDSKEDAEAGLRGYFANESKKNVDKKVVKEDVEHIKYVKEEYNNIRKAYAELKQKKADKKLKYDDLDRLNNRIKKVQSTLSKDSDKGPEAEKMKKNLDSMRESVTTMMSDIKTGN